MDPLPLQLKLTRIGRGLKQIDVAELALVTQPDVSNAERGQPLPRERILRIALALGIDLAGSEAVG